MKFMINTRLMLLLFAVLLPLTVSAKTKETNVVSIGTSDTYEGAINSALRSALEQTCGAFVYGSTAIENDKLLNDEVVSVSKGNISSYSLLEKVHANGQWTVSLDVHIGLEKLVSMAKLKMGENNAVEVDLTDLKNAYDLSQRMNELRMENERRVIQNLYEEVLRILSTAQLCKVKYFQVDQPIMNNMGTKVLVSMRGSAVYTDEMIVLENLIFSTLKSLTKINLNALKEQDEGTFRVVQSKADQYNGIFQKGKIYIPSGGYSKILLSLKREMSNQLSGIHIYDSEYIIEQNCELIETGKSGVELTNSWIEGSSKKMMYSVYSEAKYEATMISDVAHASKHKFELK